MTDPLKWQHYEGEVILNCVRWYHRYALSNEAWFPFAYISDPLPQDPTATKWYREMSFDPIPVMEKLNVPVLLIYGEQDPWIPITKSIANWQNMGRIISRYAAIQMPITSC